MPVLPTKSSSDLLYRRERRILYAHRILKEQSFQQGETNRVELVSGSAGINSSSAILPMKVGAFFITPEERATILGDEESTPDPIVIPDPVASYLPTNGTTSTWTDVGGALNATMTGSPSYSSSLGYTFNGTSQYGRIASSDGITNFNNTDTYSIEVWFNPSTGQDVPPGDTPGVVEKWNSTNQARYPYVIRYRESNTSIFIAAFDGTENPSLNIPGAATNTWVHTVAVFNFTTDVLTGYKNGSASGTTSLVGVGTVSNTSEVAIAHRIVAADSSAEKLFKGSIGLIRFYNTALSAAQVSQLFTNTRSTFGI